jgi:hypothetical protein
MKTFLCILLNLLFAATVVFSQQTFSLAYEEPFGSVSTSQSPTIVPSLQKSARLRSNKGGNLVAVVDATAANKLSPLCSSVIENALSLWSEQLYFPNDRIVKIYFKFGSLNSNIAYKVNETYTVIDGIAYTWAFASVMKGVVEPQSIDPPAILITFNNNPNIWYFEGDQEGVQNKYDFKTATLRAIAQVLGFKSTVSNHSTPRVQGDNNNIPVYSAYDRNIINSNNTLLSSFPAGQSAGLSTFVTGNNVYWKVPNTGYKLYAPSTYKQNLSVNYFDSQGELMSYDFKSNECIWQIDDKILQVLKDIGWIVQDDAIKINCSGINETGIANLYNSYTFTASANGNTITNHQWIYRIKNIDGTYETIKTANTSTFAISPITISSQYARNSDGDLIGEIGLTGTVNGVSQKATLNLYLECEPGEITFSTKVNRLTESEYNVEITLSSKGAELWTITTRNWDVGVAWVDRFTDYQYIKLIVSDLYYGSEIQFIFRAANQYGYKEISYDMPKVYYRQTLPNVNWGTVNSILVKEATLFEAYTLDGGYVTKKNSKTELDNVLQPGVYIIRAADANGNTLQTEKIITK